MAVQRKNYGRYDRIEEAVHPGPALPRAPKRMKGKVEIVVAAVEDPNPIGGEKLRRQRVAVNAHTDALEMEYAYRRISTAAYLAGRVYQQVLEASRGRRTGGCRFEPGDRTRPISAYQSAIIAQIERAQDAADLILWTRSKIGAWRETVLSGALGDGLTFQQIAIQQRNGTDWGRRVIARTFREGLEGIAVEWDAHY